jgi:cytochrome c oxidase cbb3-type subunit 1
MLDAARPFIDSVTLTIPFLKWRSIGGLAMTLGHLVFATHFLVMVLKPGPPRHAPAVFYAPKESRA